MIFLLTAFYKNIDDINNFTHLPKYIFWWWEFRVCIYVEIGLSFLSKKRMSTTM